ncbi:MAG: DivIVA domain-containing protein [bacterium]|nr:DivIVA domain-containing protein [bacterium]
MAITIDDIYDKEFALKGGGYDRNDVDQFLDEICDEMTNMLDHIAKLEDDLKQAQMEVEAAKAAARNAAPQVVKSEPVARTSETLEGILISAQKLADEAVANAKTKAEGIVKEAEEKAIQIVDEARTEKKNLSEELEKLQKNVTEYKAGFLSMLNKYKSLLEGEKL